MSILIKGMEIPEGCQKCTFLRKSYFECSPEYQYSCILGAKKIPIPWYYQLHNRADDCPLVEIPPHGRLIDADRLLIQRENYDTYNDYSETFDMIDNAPTVIESEEE